MPYSINPSNGKLEYKGIDAIIKSTAPTVTDTKYPKGKVWIDTSTSQVFMHLGSGDWNQIDAGAGFVTAPVSSTDNAIVRFDGGDGTTIQDSNVIIDDSDNVSGIGNITLTGTVDGRDVAADGSSLDTAVSKLAGIEAGATADQTASELLTAIKTVDGTTSGLDADLLDGNEATAFANASHTHATSDITSGTFADARIAETNVTQHQSALSVTESQISDLGSYIEDISGSPLSELSDSTITAIASGEILKWNGSAWINNTLAEAGISATGHTHSTSDVTSGTFADGRIAESNVTQHEGAINHDNLSGFVSNEHIDWTNASNNLDTSGTAKTSDLIVLNGGVISFRNVGDSADDVTITHSTNNLAFDGVSGSGNYSFDYDVDVTGDITVSGTVDGRDIAADGTALDTAVSKLSGIEAGADVTDATNVNAAGATMNTDTDVSGNSYVLDEDTLSSDSATKLATQQSIKAYVDANAGSTAELNDVGDVTITSIASGEIIKWNGSAYINNTLAEAGISATGHSHATTDITSGTFADARIAESNVTQHEAALSVTESQISDLGSYITDISGSPLSQLSDATITAIASGEILKWNGSAWINNTLAEAGIAAASHTHATSDINSGTMADARIAESNVTQHQAALTVTESQISDLGSYIEDISGSPLSQLSDATITSIASGEILKWNGSAWINNTLAEAGIAAASHTHATSDVTSGTFADARIAESNVTQHQAAITGTGALNSGSITSGFGNIDNGSSTLDTGALTAGATICTQLDINVGASGDPKVIYDINGTDEWYTGVDDSDGDAFKIGRGGTVGTNTSIQIDSSGYSGTMLNPKFRAYNSADDNNVTGDGTTYNLDFNTEVFDVGANFASDTWTVPVAGYYYCHVQIQMDNINGVHTSVELNLNMGGTNVKHKMGGANSENSSSQLVLQCSGYMDLAASDTCYCSCKVSNGTKVIDINGGVQISFFEGWLHSIS